MSCNLTTSSFESFVCRCVSSGSHTSRFEVLNLSVFVWRTDISHPSLGASYFGFMPLKKPSQPTVFTLKTMNTYISPVLCILDSIAFDYYVFDISETSCKLLIDSFLIFAFNVWLSEVV